MADIDYSELSYDRMIVNPTAVPQKKCPSEVYDIFKKYKEFLEETPDIDRKKLFRYIPLVYDKNSPLRTVISDIKKIKTKAAELAGFNKDDNGRFLKPVEEVILCNDRVVNAMIIRYVLEHKSAKYHEMVVLSEAHVKLSVNVLEAPTDKDIKNFQTVGTQVDNIKQELLSGDNSSKLQEDLLHYYFEDKLQLRPEDIARKRAAKQPLV